MSKLAFIFPGQGAQAIGMGSDLNASSPEAAAVFRAVDEAIGRPISTLCFEGPDAALKETQNTQPALFAASAAALEACRAAGLKPDAVAGHSIGEYAALYAAGVLDLATAARLVSQRGEAMSAAAQAHPGTMAAVLGLDAAVVAEVCSSIERVVVPANDNCPGQVVISGEISAVEAAAVALKERGAKRVLPLAVSGAFHSPLMENAAQSMAVALAEVTVSTPAVPVIQNVTANYASAPDEIRKNLSAQVAGPVRWTETIQRFVADGYTTFIECGPGNVLAGLIKRIAPEAKTYSVGDMASLQAALTALENTGQS